MSVEEISSAPMTMPDQAVEQATPPPEPPSESPPEPITDDSVGRNLDVTA